jgi:hypothetical protein
MEAKDRRYVTPELIEQARRIDAWLQLAMDGPPPQPPGRRGPKPGTVRRYDDVDRSLFGEIERLGREEQLTITAACQRIAEGGKVAGNGTANSRAARLAKVYRNSLKLSETK